MAHLLALLAAIVAIAAPQPAEQEIVVHGESAGATLDIHPAKQGDAIIVSGWLDPARTHGCTFVRRLLVRCPLSAADRLRVKMGPSGDFVRVTRRLPIPVVVELGDGSDKFIGNGERDFCFSQGARRNRCVGGPGRDICVTGNQNSDCVGGTGNDLCIHGKGSDGCWGGPGRDVCYMRSGQDGCHGGPGDDRLYGGAQPDQLYGGPGRDYCNGGPGIGRSHTCELGPQH